ncbi:hypothetical protein LJC49_05980, partial [Ruminococcaceae bacterium OttesenSCG-928-I18]|nr:hypothetical protein [Ruminococcaceae bacterium OttesenSCG-928-I18]
MKKFSRYINAKTVCLLFGLLFVLSLVPLLLMGQYAHPAADDFGNGRLAREAIVQTGQLLPVLGAAFEYMKTLYFTWQGSYAACFLMCLQPGVFGTEWYAVTPFLMIFTYTAGVLLLCWAVFVKLFGGRPALVFSAAFALLLYSFQ